MWLASEESGQGLHFFGASSGRDTLFERNQLKDDAIETGFVERCLHWRICRRTCDAFLDLATSTTGNRKREGYTSF